MRFTVTPGTVTGRSASNATWRATFHPCSPTGVAQPTMTSSIRSGGRAMSASRPRTSPAARSSGRTSRKPPPLRPIGVRLAATITASRGSSAVMGQIPAARAFLHVSSRFTTLPAPLRGMCETTRTSRIRLYAATWRFTCSTASVAWTESRTTT